MNQQKTVHSTRDIGLIGLPVGLDLVGLIS